jgi:hypothetical protein
MEGRKIYGSIIQSHQGYVRKLSAAIHFDLGLSGSPKVCQLGHSLAIIINPVNTLIIY